MAQKKVQKASAKKPIAKKPLKPVAKKATKPVSKKSTKIDNSKKAKPVAKKAVAKKAVVKAVAKKPIAKKPVSKPVVNKKAVAKKVNKPIAKKTAVVKTKKPIAKKVSKPIAKKVVKPVAKNSKVKATVKKAAVSAKTNKVNAKNNHKKSIQKPSKPLAKNAKKSTAKSNKKEIIKKTSKPVAKKVTKSVPTKKVAKPAPKKALVKKAIKATPIPAKKVVAAAPKKVVAPLKEDKKSKVIVDKKAIQKVVPKKEEKVESSKTKATIHHEDVSSKPIMSLPRDIKGTVVNVVKPKLNREEKKALKEKLKLKAQAQKKAHSKIDYAEVRRLAKIKAQAEIDNYLKLNPKRRLLKLEFVIRSSPTILYTFLKSSSCLALWFCDVCSENSNDYSFTWNGDTQHATLVEDHEDESVKYKWVNAPKEEFIEFSISKSEISFDTILTIKEFIDAGDESSQTELWEEQVKSLVKHIGG